MHYDATQEVGGAFEVDPVWMTEEGWANLPTSVPALGGVRLASTREVISASWDKWGGSCYNSREIRPDSASDPDQKYSDPKGSGPLPSDPKGSGPRRGTRADRRRPGWWADAKKTTDERLTAFASVREGYELVIQRAQKAANIAWATTLDVPGCEKLEKEAGKWRNRLEKMTKCCTGLTQVALMRCVGCGEESYLASLGCGIRTCPTCLPKLRAQNIVEIQKAVHAAASRYWLLWGKPIHWRFVTLTVKSYKDGELGQMLDDLDHALRKLLARKWWKTKVSSCILVFEGTRSANGWHMHVHALVDGYLDRDQLCHQWHTATGGRGEASGQHISDVGLDAAAAVRECVKYIGKDLGGGSVDGTEDKRISADPERMAEFLVEMEGFRTVRTYGLCYDREAEVEETVAPECTKCGCTVREFVRTVTFTSHEWAVAMRAQSERDRARRQTNGGPP